MTDQVYKELMNRFVEQGGRYPGMDIPEFYPMARALFTPEEASVVAAMPQGLFAAEQVAQTLDKSPEEVESILQTMAGKGLCFAMDMGGTQKYALPPFVPGIFEFQFMRGTKTEHDRKLAKLIYDYKEAYDAIHGIPKVSFPGARVITVDEKVEPGNKVHTYDQVSAYVESSDPISVVTCYCRHEAELIDPDDTCGKPNEVCMQFGMGARYLIDHCGAREVSKKQALEILRQAEEAGLVHLSMNRQQIEFICNCCADHCIGLVTALAQPKPGLALNSGFQPDIDQEECTSCDLCIDNCPATALAMSEDDVLLLDLDRCFGCGVCATFCPTEAIALVAKPGYPELPLNQAALDEALRAETTTS
jgi:Pyruvate/2-oxoacid:ferredoxin oxidoreductase delta subunit